MIRYQTLKNKFRFDDNGKIAYTSLMGSGYSIRLLLFLRSFMFHSYEEFAIQIELQLFCHQNWSSTSENHRRFNFCMHLTYVRYI